MLQLRPGADVRHHSGVLYDLDNRNPIYDNLRQRLEDIGQLTLKTGNYFRVIHYGPGGSIRVHSDYSLPSVS